MDIDQLVEERVLELFGPETSELDEDYQTAITLQRVQLLPLSTIDTTNQLKAQAKYDREAAAKLTKYSLEPTFNMPSTIRAIPINNNEKGIADPETTQSSSNNEDPGTSQDTQTILQAKMSNNSKHKAQYKENRRMARQQKRQRHQAAHSTTK